MRCWFQIKDNRHVLFSCNHPQHRMWIFIGFMAFRWSFLQRHIKPSSPYLLTMAPGVYYFVSFERRSAKCDCVAEVRFRQSGMSYWQESAVTLTDFILRGEVGSWLQPNDAVSETVVGMRTKIMGYHLFLIVVGFSVKKEFHGDWRPGPTSELLSTEASEVEKR